MKELTLNQMKGIIGGEITILAIMTIMTAAIVAVIIYRLFMSSEGSCSIPGGFKFEWE